MKHCSAPPRPRATGQRYGYAALLVLALASPAWAEPSLVIGGNIAHYTDTGTRTFTFSPAGLAQLSQHEITTATDWTPKGTFSGPLLRDLLAKAGARGKSVKFFGADEYSITIPIADFHRYDAILAWRWNGKPLKVEDYGPFWVMYPLPDMKQAETNGDFPAKLIWQVKRMEVR
ncbi:molybdopterin-dependent oxidoreductase [Chromobacterium paludis]|uniref:Molybdopterin-dependent oxidoreductase n=1 Tax=Chromobacterium paludis TaxID=2605945 RepID=A0A5C1DFJ6_9NEIS|nr:molybdopterin-dependent oxidoreductase [Chromobacterium paludis]QEL54739.1 molybdopterin-dependent oxidoreductase [Chromobacterium paludis]